MKASKKLNLDEIKVESFVTSLTYKEKKTVQAGDGTSSPENQVCYATAVGTATFYPPTTETATTIESSVEVGNLTLTVQQSREMASACVGCTAFGGSFGNGCNSGVADPEECQQFQLSIVGPSPVGVI